MFRSEQMSLCQLFVQSEAAYFCVAELGNIGLVQFIDLNASVSAFQRRYVSEIRRCDEMERQLRYLDKEIRKARITIPDSAEKPDTPPPHEMTQLEVHFERMDKEVREMNSNAETLKSNYLGLTELQHILETTQKFFDEWHRPSITSAAAGGGQRSRAADHDAVKNGDTVAVEIPLPEEALSLLAEDAGKPGNRGAKNLGFLAGVLERQKMLSFERLLWRACRGNIFFKQSETPITVEDPATGDEVQKSVFVIIFQGDKLRITVTKICQGFRATLYPCPDAETERNKMSIDVATKLVDMSLVLKQTETYRHATLKSVAEHICDWVLKVRRMKAVYHALNTFNFDCAQRCLIAECWCPVADIELIRAALERGTEQSEGGFPAILNSLETTKTPPTFNRTNKFTDVFQGVVDSYGVATYREMNPAPFTIVTFPFLFSIMFGDAGHGVLMFAASLWMVVMERKLLMLKSTNEIWNIMFGGRYIILLMGAFSIYSGLLYNDVFSKSINIFGSAWFPHQDRYSFKDLSHHLEFTLDPTNNTDYTGHSYPFGMDPIWQLAENKVSWLNSLKMKISVIFGVSQMMFGVMLSLLNHCYFRDPVSIIGEFIPQVIFLLSMFGYLIILIFYKWITVDASKSGCAPSLLIGLINMFLYNYPEEPCSVAEFYPGQKLVQSVLLLVLAVCVPWLVFVKPLALRCVHNRKAAKSAAQYEVNSNDIEMKGETSQQPTQEAKTDEKHEKFDMGEVFIHQCIHTIEYCLGCISHTASYLRLWALSLAHAELSEVLWKMIFHLALTMEGYVGAAAVFVMFAPWAALTVAILLLMEGLSAFLHTLRLHWVEFQSKFYQGLGYSFDPMAFDKISTNLDMASASAAPA